MEPVVANLADLFRAVHHQLRDAVCNLDAEGLAWRPCPDTNSIATLVVHLLSAEREALLMARGLDPRRDRDAELVPRAEGSHELAARIDAADELLDQMAPAVTAADLGAMRERALGGTNTSLYWLLRYYGHSREHLAHVQLTRQLYEQRKAAGVAD